MKVVILSDVNKNMKKGQILDISDGYAKNFLIPRGLAKEATTQALNEAKAAEEAIQFKKQEAEKEAKNVCLKINDGRVKITAKSGVEGKLFGSITSKEIAEKINEKYDVKVNKRKISLENEIRTLGSYSIKVEVYPNIVANLTVDVVEE